MKPYRISLRGIDSGIPIEFLFVDYIPQFLSKNPTFSLSDITITYLNTDGKKKLSEDDLSIEKSRMKIFFELIMQENPLPDSLDDFSDKKFIQEMNRRFFEVISHKTKERLVNLITPEKNDNISWIVQDFQLEISTETSKEKIWISIPLGWAIYKKNPNSQF